ncbi:acyl-CoA ligase (AMP-forming), exosortase A system-associated [Pseudoduganella plicata]|uniref:Acyl-CoA ligase (AMP-forming), exosortase A system-associated n=1 Tax=Pseudoduganella plicata TaxID=321984 RepID=A0A4P7BFC0_9BURK|nr:acyl-CoA ligase (AMP-forming), exosortase A system-associated [Pseudoduganella plicata]QBQ37354.1 acyl-CoA ligase (AMP-forming), exosortase A system-associated [Pseudoduganella plicata]GGZ08943.1 acyl-CoA ligase (AMP-forming), exosortase A system-associated [Pseudoduganella plicata]
MSDLIHDFIFRSAQRTPDAEALVYGQRRLTYAHLARLVKCAAAALLAHGLERGERVAVYLEKNVENVGAMFGAAAAGGVFVPVNPLLKPEQVGYILADCNVRVLVTSIDRLKLLLPVLAGCRDLRTVLVTGVSEELPALQGVELLAWDDTLSTVAVTDTPAHRAIDGDMAAILYTSGSTGKPKGVVLSHRNMVAGAVSVAGYLDNTPQDRILAVLPLSFDYGLSQLTTAFHVGATAVLINHLLPRDVLNAVMAERITGLAAVPPLWIQLAQLNWPADCTLRYLTNSGGAMQRPTLDALRRALPAARPFLMYGLTEAFRSTFLPPEELDRRPDSMGKAIPNAEVMVLRPDGTECAPGEPGELVHRGALVSLGYWNDPAKTAERFKPIAPRHYGLPLTELAVWSGDTVRKDEEGFLYFISRSDEMIKTSGYRVSPTEVEEVVYAREHVAEAAALGIAHPTLGQAIVVIAYPRDGAALMASDLLAACKPHLPAYMLPQKVVISTAPLPRNPNGKIDRKLLSSQYENAFTEAP